MGEFVALVTGIAWPALIAGGVWYFRSYIRDGLDAVQRQMSSGAGVKWKDFEFTGVNLREFVKGGSTGYRTESATAADLKNRDSKYAEQKNLFLVHRVVATGKVHPQAGLPTYDVLVQLISHKHYGHLNEVKKVEYYFGKFFGRDAYDLGARFIVENGSDGFAVRVDAYGPTLCEATLHFHDGSSSTCSRYLDFGGTLYNYDPAVSDYDAKLIARAEEKR